MSCRHGWLRCSGEERSDFGKKGHFLPFLARWGVDRIHSPSDRSDLMIKRKCRAVSGLLSGALALSGVAQEPAAPAAEPVKPASTEAEKPAEADPRTTPSNVGSPPEGAEKTESGLASLVLKKGTGTENPAETDVVKVHYTGWKSSDGVSFDSSYNRNEPTEFPLNRVIKGWTEGVQLMVVGEKRRFWIPSALAYGDSGRVAGDLTFDIELLEIVKAPEPPKAPENLVAPADAVATESGLKFKILKEGEGDETPNDDSMVMAHFTGWKADGEFLNTSKEQPQPSQFALANLTIKGWSEAFKLMKKGETRRVWIPADLAFGKEGEAPAGAPTGDLIFDLEMVDFRAIPKPPPPPRAADAPDNVAEAPADAAKTESGIPFVVQKAGEGDTTPKDGDLVKFNFSGWDANGAALASSKSMGRPMSRKLDALPIAGWVDLLKEMKKGETRRAWIPENLTFVPKIPGTPEGALTFDLELVEFKVAPSAPETPADVAAVPELSLIHI